MVRAESTIMLHSAGPVPLAGETVIHGLWVFATHLCGELSLTLATPPSGPISTDSVSIVNSVGSFSVQAAARASGSIRASINLYAVFVIFIPSVKVNV